MHHRADEGKSRSAPSPARVVRLVEQVIQENRVPSSSSLLLGMGGEWSASERALNHAPVSAAQWLCLYSTLSPVLSFHLPPFLLLPHSTASVCLHPHTPAQTSACGCPYKEPYGRRNPSQPIKTCLTLSSKEQRKNKCQTSTAEGRIQPMLKDTNLHQ